MENDKKVTPPKQELKIVSRPSNEELSDDIIDEKHHQPAKTNPINNSSETTFGEGVED